MTVRKLPSLTATALDAAVQHRHLGGDAVEQYLEPLELPLGALGVREAGADHEVRHLDQAGVLREHAQHRLQLKLGLTQAAAVALELGLERTILKRPVRFLEKLEGPAPALATIEEDLVRPGVREQREQVLVLLGR